jgi:hypothetical protein
MNEYRQYRITQQFTRLVAPLALIFTRAFLAFCHRTLDTPDIIDRPRDTQLPLILGFPLTVVVDAVSDSSEVAFVLLTYSAVTLVLVTHSAVTIVLLELSAVTICASDTFGRYNCASDICVTIVLVTHSAVTIVLVTHSAVTIVLVTYYAVTFVLLTHSAKLTIIPKILSF